MRKIWTFFIRLFRKENKLSTIESTIIEFKQRKEERHGWLRTFTVIVLDNGMELKTYNTIFAKILYDVHQLKTPVELVYDKNNTIQSILPSRSPGKEVK